VSSDGDGNGKGWKLRVDPPFRPASAASLTCRVANGGEAKSSLSCRPLKKRLARLARAFYDDYRTLAARLAVRAHQEREKG
jgi:hypothetical protein